MRQKNKYTFEEMDKLERITDQQKFNIDKTAIPTEKTFDVIIYLKIERFKLE